jgi:hypothetical protein
VSKAPAGILSKLFGSGGFPDPTAVVAAVREKLAVAKRS